ncbi:hypothetical protein [Pustulibacterium marinum]|uniref:hypothetical protein n=1 Tax=Pustulibacterium marinum TaxID=1224947 RepID=UPI0011609D80|nr:hypothetical protein [Pustulibacterium marinum]
MSAVDFSKIEEIKDHDFQNIEVTPKGNFLLHNYFELFIFENTLKDIKAVSGPLDMDDIQFLNWNNNCLKFRYNELGNWNKQLIMEYNEDTKTVQYSLGTVI